MSAGRPGPLPQALRALVEGRHLSEEEAHEAMIAVMRGDATPAQIAGFLVALRVKGETPPEIAGCCRALRECCVAVPVAPDGLVDTCGTGGDGASTFNVSTAAAFVAAGAGVRVAKHGNRAVSSRCGSADVLEALGVRLSLDPAEAARCLERHGIVFLFAPAHHPAMRHAVEPRRELGVRTLFNLIGPLANPAGARRQLLGVYSPALTATVAEVLRSLGAERAMVVHGMEGLDEISVCGPTRVSSLNGGRIRSYTIEPRDAGLPAAEPGAIGGGTPGENAGILRAVLEGEPGPCRDVVLLNAGAAILVAGLARDLAHGARLAAAAVDSGRAMEKLQALRDFGPREEAA